MNCVFVNSSTACTEVVASGSKEWGLRFLRSPVEFISDEHRKKLTGVKLEINRLEVMDAVCTFVWWIVNINGYGGG